jgi:hypothetical protein
LVKVLEHRVPIIADCRVAAPQESRMKTLQGPPGAGGLTRASKKALRSR